MKASRTVGLADRSGRGTHAGGKVRLIVCVYLRWSPKHKAWGSSEFTEEEGPGARSCPLRFLDLVPEVADPDWREEVRK